MLVFLLAALESDEDKKLFTEIYEQYRPQMERTAMHFLKSYADVEDAVQNAFMQMIRHFEKIYEIPCEELSFWIISIVKNEALMIIRKSQKTVPLEDWDGLVKESENTSDYTELVDLFTKLRNRQSRQRLDRHGTIVVGSCETFHHYNVQGVK